MNMLSSLIASGYPADLLAGMLVNFRIAAVALVLGFAVGAPVLAMQMASRAGRRLVAPVVGVMRAAPTFVVMFFLLNVIPADVAVFGAALTLSPPTIVALSLAPYAGAYIVDNGGAAARGLGGGSPGEALLFLPNLLRAYTVLVMSSSAGVAIGVTEGVAVVLREAERHAELGDQMVVFAVGVFAFGVVFQAGFAIVRIMVRRMSLRGAAPAGPPSAPPRGPR